MSRAMDENEMRRRFLEAMSNPATNHSSPTQGRQSEEAVTTSPATEKMTSSVNSGTPANLDDDLSAASALTSPPSRSRGGSDSAQIPASPHVAGLRAPQNTPQVLASTAKTFPGDDIPSPGDISGRFLSEFAENLPKKPLSESIWAPKTHSHTTSPLAKKPLSSNVLTPTKVVEHNDDIHHDFPRMSFRAVDLEHQGESITGSQVPVNSLSRSPSADVLTAKLSALEILRSPGSNEPESAGEASFDDLLSMKMSTLVDKLPAPEDTRSTSELSHGQDSTLSSKTIKEPLHDVIKPSEDNLLPHLRFEKPSQKPSVSTEPKIHNDNFAVETSEKSGETAVTPRNAASPEQRSIVKEEAHDLDEKAIAAHEKPSLASSSETKTPDKNINVKKGQLSSSAQFMAGWLASSYTAAKSSTKGKENAKEEKQPDLENEVFFRAWPSAKSQARVRPAAQIRTVILTSLPPKATLTFVAKLIFGGPLECIYMGATTSSATTTTATVRFLYAQDCQKFYDATSNGLIYKNPNSVQDNEQVFWVTKGKDVDVVSGRLREAIDFGCTRCVRAAPVDPEIEHEELLSLAEQKGRRLENVEVRCNKKTGARVVVWRFADIKWAVDFKNSLARDEEWETCNISFTDDPCMHATGPDE